MGEYDGRRSVDEIDDVMEKKWATIREDYRRKYPRITDNDVDYLVGGFQKMLGIIASRTNRSRAEVSNEIRYWKL